MALIPSSKPVAANSKLPTQTVNMMSHLGNEFTKFVEKSRIVQEHFESNSAWKKDDVPMLDERLVQGHCGKSRNFACRNKNLGAGGCNQGNVVEVIDHIGADEPNRSVNIERFEVCVNDYAD